MIDELPAVAWPLQRNCPMAVPTAYAELRSGPPQPVQFDNGRRAWLLTRHEDIRLALLDTVRFSSDAELPGFPSRYQVPHEYNMNSFWRMDPPEHPRQRHMVVPEFTGRRVKDMRPELEALIEGLLDEVAAGPREVDLFSAFCLQLPTKVIARVLGVPESDYKMFSSLSNQCLALDNPAASVQAYMDMTKYVYELVGVKAENPGDDLISTLYAEQVATEQLGLHDFVSLLRLLLVAGFETTSSQLSLSILTLLTNPEVRATVEQNPDRITDFVEESLRFWSVSHDNILRLVIEDVEFAGVQMKKGDALMTALPSANHDGSIFPNPDEFDIDRDTKKHMAFGHGSHLCPGAALARREVEMAVLAVLRRFPNLKLAKPADELPYRHTSLVYGLEALPVTF